MKGFHKRNVLLIVTLTALVLAFTSVFSLFEKMGKTNPVSSVIQTAMLPVQRAFSGTGKKAGGFFDAVRNAHAYREQNEQLKDEVAALKQEIRAIESVKQENERLRALLHFKQAAKGLDTVACEVIAKDAGNWLYTLKIDKGETDGIRPGDAVVCRQALVGKVTQTGKNWAEVTSILDNRSAVGARVIRTEDIAVLEGDLTLSSKGCARLSFLSDEAELVEGDTVETSGIGGVYPEGIFIGTVSELFKKNINQNTAIIKTEADFLNVREVTVIKQSN